jgi:2-deoxy-D-gluconate 3-dehydrogenase
MASSNPSNDFSVEGKSAIVVGAEHSVGCAAAVTLAEAGAKILLASQEPGTDKQLKETAKLVTAAGAKPEIRVQSAALRADLSATVDLAARQLGGLHILVNALDTPAFGPADAADDTAFDKIIENNLKTVWMSCQEGARVMMRQGGGVIVNITSVLA